MSGGEFVLPLTTMNFAAIPRVFLRITILNSPLIGNAFCRVLSLVWLVSSVGGWFDLWIRALNWCSSVMFASVPLSGSTCTSSSSIMTSINLFLQLAAFSFLACARCWAAWVKNSPSEVVELSSCGLSCLPSVFFLIWPIFCSGPLDLCGGVCVLFRGVSPLEMFQLVTLVAFLAMGGAVPSLLVISHPQYPQGGAFWGLSYLRRGCCVTLATSLTPSGDFMSRICSDVSSIGVASVGSYKSSILHRLD